MRMLYFCCQEKTLTAFFIMCIISPVVEGFIYGRKDTAGIFV